MSSPEPRLGRQIPRTGPEGEYVLIGWFFLRIIGLIFFAAFSSWWLQIRGLLGEQGILPVHEFLQRAEYLLGFEKFWRIPTLFWLDASDTALEAACVAGMGASLLVLFGRFTRTGLALSYLLYLSLVQVGQAFAAFQWDAFLLECGFLALFLTGGSPLVVWLYRFLLFRFMFMGGVVKLASGDPAWSHLAALDYHFETQPLPSPLAWYAHRLPEPILRLATGAVFCIELVVPFFVFLRRPFRLFAAVNFLLLQGGIMLTGNYNFFNLLTISLCLFLLEDRDLRPLLGSRLTDSVLSDARSPDKISRIAAVSMGGLTLVTCVGLLWWTSFHRPPAQPVAGLTRLASTFGWVNGYGPFAVMTRNRNEIIVEGSEDGTDWRAYEFKYKPGDLSKPLTWNIPHQPRLDWQMWFAALSDASHNPWFLNFMDKLRQGSKPVLSLLETNPFPERPPNYLRAGFYRYSFTDWTERQATGRIWRREFLGYYYGKSE